MNPIRALGPFPSLILDHPGPLPPYGSGEVIEKLSHGLKEIGFEPAVPIVSVPTTRISSPRRCWCQLRDSNRRPLITNSSGESPRYCRNIEATDLVVIEF
jgi:hypothetical protein